MQDVERADAQPNHIGSGSHLDIERGPAVTTKRPSDFVTTLRLRDKRFGVPLVSGSARRAP